MIEILRRKRYTFISFVELEKKFMRKTKEEAQITREKIIQASYELIGEKGYERMTRDDIAARVGMTRGAVNWHFSSKEEIYLAALDRILDEFQSERRACFEDKTARPKKRLSVLFPCR